MQFIEFNTIQDQCVMSNLLKLRKAQIENNTAEFDFILELRSKLFTILSNQF